MSLQRPAMRSLAALFGALSLGAQFPAPVNRYDRSGTAANSQERTLFSGNVNEAGFGKLYSYYVDGAVYAQPLYMPGVAIAGQAARNVLIVATMNDKVYAFDADRPGPPLWMRSFTDEMAGVTPVPVTDVTNNNELNLVGNIGIEGTPVIDPSSGALFFVARTRENGKYVQRLHKLDLRDGKDLVPPTVIEASVPGSAKDAVNGELRFDPKSGNQRSALALANGAVIVAWASHEDIRPYHGWVMAYDARTLERRAAWCVTPDGAEGGIWQSGRGPAVDEAGNIYFETGNGDWDGRRNFGTSLVRLVMGAGGLEVADFFTPKDFQLWNQRDADLGSSGPLLVPGTDLLIAGSKMGMLYLFNKAKLGRMTPEDSGPWQQVNIQGGRILAGPALWDGPQGMTLFLWCESDFLKAFRLRDGSLEPTPYARADIANHGSPGGALTVTSDGKRPHTGIVWTTNSNNKSADHGNAPGVLRAFDAETLDEIWNSERKANRDRLGTLVKFVPPLVMAGKVYVPNYDNAVEVYGLLSAR